MEKLEKVINFNETYAHPEPKFSAKNKAGLTLNEM